MLKQAKRQTEHPQTLRSKSTSPLIQKYPIMMLREKEEIPLILEFLEPILSML